MTFLALFLKCARAALLLAVFETPAWAQEDAAQAALQRGNDLFEAGDLDGAEAEYDAAAKLFKDSPLIRFNLGTVAYKREDYQLAERLFNESLQSDDPFLVSRARYNLGNVKYKVSLYAMHTFRDAVTPLRAAMVFYREVLEIDPAFEDALYNLELAHKFLKELQNQNVQPQASPRVRDQKPSENRGQSFQNEDATKDRPAEDDARPDRQETPDGKQAQQAPQSDAPAESGSQSDQMMGPQQDMSLEEAQRLIDVTRDRAQAAQDQRNQARRARVRNSKAERIW